MTETTPPLRVRQTSGPATDWRFAPLFVYAAPLLCFAVDFTTDGPIVDTVPAAVWTMAGLGMAVFVLGLRLVRSEPAYSPTAFAFATGGTAAFAVAATTIGVALLPFALFALLVPPLLPFAILVLGPLGAGYSHFVRVRMLRAPSGSGARPTLRWWAVAATGFVAPFVIALMMQGIMDRRQTAFFARFDATMQGAPSIEAKVTAIQTLSHPLFCAAKACRRQICRQLGLTGSGSDEHRNKQDAALIEAARPVVPWSIESECYWLQG